MFPWQTKDTKEDNADTGKMTMLSDNTQERKKVDYCMLPGLAAIYRQENRCC